jgi:hypothetical protein
MKDGRIALWTQEDNVTRLTSLKSEFFLQRSGVDAVPDEATGMRSGADQGNVGATDHEPLREQLWRRREAAEQYRRSAHWT